MLRNYLAAALRSLARHALYSAISIVGLAIGLCAALLAGLVIRNELSYDRFIPGYDRVYLLMSEMTSSGRPPVPSASTHHGVAPLLQLNFRQIAAATRLAPEDVRLKHGEVEAREKIYWADPNVFEVLPLPVLAGDLENALQAPDGIVLTRSAARKYFGRDAPIGATLVLDRTRPMTVKAVLRDLPVNGTQFETGIFASGLAANAPLMQFGRDPPNPNNKGFGIDVQTYFRLAPGASIDELRGAVPGMLDRFMPPLPPGISYSMPIVRLDKFHLFPGLNPGVSARLAMMGAVGALILFVACINFVNLLTARVARRSREVGVRKTAGAGRGSLILQFLGEALLYVLLAICIAMALVELALPPVNAFLDTGAVFDYWRDPQLLSWLGACSLILALLTGFYPALVLSAFHPVDVLRKRGVHAGGAAVRRVLVILQFAVLIGLVIAASIVYQQHRYATAEALRVDTDQILLIHGRCTPALKAELRALPGVRGAGCSHESLLTRTAFGSLKLKDGSVVSVDMAYVDAGVLDLYGLHALAGDYAAVGSGGTAINENAARRFGFASPAAAIGQLIPVSPADRGIAPPSTGDTIIAVVPDFSIDAAQEKIRPAIYRIDPHNPPYDLITLKLSGRNIPEALTAIDQLWTKMRPDIPINRIFLDDYIQNLYLSVQRQAQALGWLSAVAIMLACLGLVGLSASTAERRTREIGIRKAMGANHASVAGLLLWEFTRPVLWANLIAWPAAAFLMHRWLEGFAYHVELEPWLFAASAAIALVIALLTVSAHCWKVAQVKPVRTLRHE